MLDPCQSAGSLKCLRYLVGAQPETAMHNVVKSNADVKVGRGGW